MKTLSDDTERVSKGKNSFASKILKIQNIEILEATAQFGVRVSNKCSKSILRTIKHWAFNIYA